MSGYGNIERTSKTGVYTNISVTTSATELKVGASALTGRDYIIIQPKDGSIFIGFDNSVTTSNGIEIKKNQTMYMALSEVISVYGIVSSGTVDVRIGELA